MFATRQIYRNPVKNGPKSTFFHHLDFSPDRIFSNQATHLLHICREAGGVFRRELEECTDAFFSGLRSLGQDPPATEVCSLHCFGSLVAHRNSGLRGKKRTRAKVDGVTGG